MPSGRVPDRIDINGTNVIRRVIGTQCLDGPPRGLRQPDRMIGVKFVDNVIVSLDERNRNLSPFRFIPGFPECQSGIVAISLNHTPQFFLFPGVVGPDGLEVRNRDRCQKKRLRGTRKDVVQFSLRGRAPFSRPRTGQVKYGPVGFHLLVSAGAPRRF